MYHCPCLLLLVWQRTQYSEQYFNWNMSIWVYTAAYCTITNVSVLCSFSCKCSEVQFRSAELWLKMHKKNHFPKFSNAFELYKRVVPHVHRHIHIHYYNLMHDSRYLRLMSILTSQQLWTIWGSNAVAWNIFTKLRRREVSLCVRQIIAGSLEDGQGCNRGTVLLSWVGTWGKRGALNALTDYRGLNFRVSEEEKKKENKVRKEEENKKLLYTLQYRAEILIR